jgi:hypothetical protein
MLVVRVLVLPIVLLMPVVPLMLVVRAFGVVPLVRVVPAFAVVPQMRVVRGFGVVPLMLVARGIGVGREVLGVFAAMPNHKCPFTHAPGQAVDAGTGGGNGVAIDRGIPAAA